ncbi:indole-3-glycerol phosphate synthase TrpC [Chrysiogenes arsenatis]|uniref:indole-3-glycerol phosphate synthase TrpC n=1 Tax=Chrysiogenes arsenatis TaxID=309797 RepID=UPI00041CC053|nr:indole-3-glycerol phosphate synthase TrpC [Chrysiogenes arsenatis]
MLTKILATKKNEVAALVPHGKELRQRAAERTEIRDFTGNMLFGDIAIIAEVKKASPSKGLICTEFDPVAIACEYDAGGARAISVLTDRDYFQGSIDYLTAVRRHVSLPVLRKDFIIDPLQIYEAAAIGADAILLIGEALSAAQAGELVAVAGEVGLHVLFEVHSADQLAKIPANFTGLVGVNNRNLSTFEVSLETSIAIHQNTGRPIVCESGIGGAEDVTYMLGNGIRMFLIGEYLMRQPDRAQALRTLRGV